MIEREQWSYDPESSAHHHHIHINVFYYLFGLKSIYINVLANSMSFYIWSKEYLFHCISTNLVNFFELFTNSIHVSHFTTFLMYVCMYFCIFHRKNHKIFHFYSILWFFFFGKFFFVCIQQTFIYISVCLLWWQRMYHHIHWVACNLLKLKVEKLNVFRFFIYHI